MLDLLQNNRAGFMISEQPRQRSLTFLIWNSALADGQDSAYAFRIVDIFDS